MNVGGKTLNTAFSSFCSNDAKQVARFCCLFNRSLKVSRFRYLLFSFGCDWIEGGTVSLRESQAVINTPDSCSIPSLDYPSETTAAICSQKQNHLMQIL